MSVIIRSSITVILFCSFIALWIWAWRKGRSGDYAAIAQLPLQDDAPFDPSLEKQSPSHATQAS